MDFDYDLAFSRNLGWLTQAESETLKSTRVAIAGLGGVGGVHLLTLTRLGISKFHVADFDQFAVENFNRQVGASMSTVGRAKVDVMIEKAKDINPELEIKPFPQGVSPENFDAFFNNVDIYIDGLDFFCLNIREKLFKYIYEKKIPGVSVGPIGMGAALINILPGKMSFDQYFGFSSAKNEAEKALLFAIGLSPSGVQKKYLVDPTRVDFKNQKVPSLPMGCELCAGVAATELLKIILKRGRVHSAPVAIQFDAYTNRIFKKWTPGGYKNPLQRLRFHFAKKLVLQ